MTKTRYTSDVRRVSSWRKLKPGLPRVMATVAALLLGLAWGAPLLAAGAKALTDQQILELIDESQKHNRSLVPVSGEGSMTWSKTVTVAGLKYEVARLKALGREAEVPESWLGEITAPQVRSHAARVVFDGDKLRWNDDRGRYAIGGPVAYEYLPDDELPRAYLCDPIKLSRRAHPYGHNARAWCFGASPDRALGKWLEDRRKKREFDVTVKEVPGKDGPIYEVALKFDTGYTDTLRFDSSRAYEVIETVLTDADGRLRYMDKREYLKTPNGAWIPRKNVSTYYKAVGEDGRTVPAEIFERTFQELKFGNVDPREFTFEGLGVPMGTTVFDKRTRNVHFVYGVSRATDRKIEELSEHPYVEDVLSQGGGQGAVDIAALAPAEDGADDDLGGILGAGANTWWIVGAGVAVLAILAGIMLGLRARARRLADSRGGDQQ